MIAPAKVLCVISLRYKSDVTELLPDCPFPAKKPSYSPASIFSSFWNRWTSLAVSMR